LFGWIKLFDAKSCSRDDTLARSIRALTEATAPMKTTALANSQIWGKPKRRTLEDNQKPSACTMHAQSEHKQILMLVLWPLLTSTFGGVSQHQEFLYIS